MRGDPLAQLRSHLESAITSLKEGTSSIEQLRQEQRPIDVATTDQLSKLFETIGQLQGAYFGLQRDLQKQAEEAPDVFALRGLSFGAAKK